MGRFAESYRKHFGATQSQPKFYGGFALFFAGAAAALVGVFIAASGTLLFDSLAGAREFGIVLAAIGLTLFLYGLQLTLPARTVVHAVSGAAVLFCVYGITRFTAAYPEQWNRIGNDLSPQIILLYAAGLVVLVTTTAMALVVNFISRHMVLPGHELDDIYADPDRPVSMEDVMRDIEREVARQNLTWGGVGGDSLPQQVFKIKADFGPEYEVSNATGARVHVLPMDENAETGYRELMRLRGRDIAETDSDDTAAAVGALIALRQARQAKLERSWWYRVKRWFVALFTGGARRHQVTMGVKPDRKNPNAEERGTGNPPPAPREAEVASRAR